MAGGLGARRKARPYSVQRAWFVLSDRRDLRFWGLVGKRVRARGVRQNDLAGVRRVVRQVERELER